MSNVASKAIAGFLVGIALVSIGVYGIVLSSNKLAIYNECSVSPDNSYFCAIGLNPQAQSDYSSNQLIEAVSGILSLAGLAILISAFAALILQPNIYTEKISSKKSEI
jgi:hypothetical protein